MLLFVSCEEDGMLLLFSLLKVKWSSLLLVSVSCFLLLLWPFVGTDSLSDSLGLLTIVGKMMKNVKLLLVQS